jgi:hypothetical protein
MRAERHMRNGLPSGAVFLVAAPLYLRIALARGVLGGERGEPRGVWGPRGCEEVVGSRTGPGWWRGSLGWLDEPRRVT